MNIVIAIPTFMLFKIGVFTTPAGTIIDKLANFSGATTARRVPTKPPQLTPITCARSSDNPSITSDNHSP